MGADAVRCCGEELLFCLLACSPKNRTQGHHREGGQKGSTGNVWRERT